MFLQRRLLSLPKMMHEYSTKQSVTMNIEDLFDSRLYRLHLLKEEPAHTSTLSRENALRFLKEMDIIRKFESACAQLYREKKIRGFCHLYTGQEAVAVGLNSIMRPQDSIITSYRCHGWAYLKCGNIAGIFAELMGFQSGLSRGKGGSMHIFCEKFYGGNGIVGGHVPLGTGIAFRHKYLDDGGISFTLYGDGAANQGQVYEAFNMAKLFNLPIIFIIENNQYAMGTNTKRSHANEDLYKQVTFLPGIRASGMDILSVIESGKFVMKHILDGKGPIVLELMTYRYFGHSMSDPGTSYRDRAEIEQVRKRKDCIQHIKQLIIEGKLATEDELKKIDDENKKVIAEQMEVALKDRMPTFEELTADLYKVYPEKLRVPKMLQWVQHKNISTFGNVNRQK